MLAPSVLQRVQNIISLEKPLELPALLSFPRSSSLLLQTGHAGREQTLKALRSIMVRLFVSLPPGRVNFTIIDPVGLGENFAGFMHAADHHEALVGRRIWTEPAHISQQLTQLTEHMENVIQKYLRNEFETIEQYNQQAGELAEPYRFLVVADFPANFDEQSAQRLTSIINSGPRCGVYTLIMYDDRRELPVGFNYEDLCSGSVHVVCEDGRFCRRDIVWQNFPLRLDTPPTEDTLTDIMNKVGSWTKDACRVEIPFQSIAPGPDEHWSLQSDKAIKVPIGRTGATRLQYLELGKGMAQHMLTAGKTGSGKSTLLHVIISNLALWYSPEELHLHLIDFKRGVEFKTYVKNKLPHARTVAIESDREFGLSILQKLDAEMARRGQLFRQAHAQDIASYRQVTGEKLPRSLLIVDEFQVFFGEDDRIAQEAAVLLEQLVRQGRAFGVHVILGSQTLAGASGLARSTMGQMAVRIALQCSEADSQIILDDNNLAARLLSRPGEAIYNDAGGMIAGNSPFQTAWLSDEIRDKYLEKISQWSQKLTQTAEPMVVFEGNIPAELSNNQILINLFKQPAQSQNATAFLGEPLAVKSPTSVTFNRQSGANLLILGQRETSALGLISSSLISLTAALTNPAAEFIVMENLPVSTEAAESLVDYAKILPSCRTISYQQTSEAIEQLAHEVRCRTENNNKKFKTTFLVINGLHRYRNLRRSEDDFSFSTDSDAPPKPDKLLAEILREGPLVGIHCIIWIDTLVSLERLFDRATLREFDMRVLFQMSSANSSNLIDSPQANNLGLHRALLYDEEHGKLEKFRPYRSPKPDWTQTVFRVTLVGKGKRMNLQTIDWAIIIGFFMVILGIGLLVSKRAGSSSAEFFLGGRSMPWWLLGVSMVATTFSTDTPNLVTDIVRKNGVSGNWLWWAFLITGMLTVFIYAKLWRRSAVMTDVEFYEIRYSGKPAAFLRGFRALYLGVFFNVMIMGTVSLAAIKIGGVLLNMSPFNSIVVALIVTVIYCGLGGFRAVLITDFILFAFAMFGAVAAAVVACSLPEVGGLKNLFAHPALAGQTPPRPHRQDRKRFQLPRYFRPHNANPHRRPVVERMVSRSRARRRRLSRPENAFCQG